MVSEMVLTANRQAEKVVVSIVVVGNLKYPIDLKYLEAWSSEIMTIRNDASIGSLENAEGTNWEYSKEQLNRLISPDHGANLTVAVINAPIEDNYYMRRLADNKMVLSLYEMAEIVRSSNYTIEHFILRNIYTTVILYAASKNRIPDDAYTWAHHEIRGCLFDMNSNKADILFSMHKPSLCPECKTRLQKKQLKTNFLPSVINELARLQKALFYRISDWVKAHPIFSMIITAGIAILLNLIASFIFKLITS